MPYMLTQVIYRERKTISFDIGTKTHLIEFSNFSRLPLVILKLSSMLDTELVIIYYKMIHEVQNQMKLSTSDRIYEFLLLDYVTKSAVFARP